MFTIAGVLHFKDEPSFRKIVPDYLPLRKTAVLITGVIEIIFGILMIKQRPSICLKRAISAFLWAVLPANVYMARKNIPLGDKQLPAWLLYARLPLQFVLIRIIHKL